MLAADAVVIIIIGIALFSQNLLSNWEDKTNTK